MKWACIVGVPREQPQNGSYSDWKSDIAQHCRHRCIYCALREQGLGERQFHVEHFRPKNDFPELENAIENLFYACSICNCFKGSDWPSEPSPELDAPSYVDPSSVDYNEFVAISDGWEVESDLPAFRYMIERLFLNRAQLIAARRCTQTVAEIVKKKEELVALLLRTVESGGTADSEILSEAILLNEALSEVLRSIQSARPYAREDLKRP